MADPDPDALRGFGSEVSAASDTEVLFVIAFAAVVRIFPPHLIRLLANTNSTRELTRREIDVLSLVALGKTNAEIAGVLWIAPGTVKKHLDHIYEKLDVGTRTEAVVAAIGLRPVTRA